MSRSNPTESSSNPSKRWFEWKGDAGHFSYYDKEAKQRIDLPPDFTFILLDETCAIRGYHEKSKSGIYSNEVRDLRAEVLVVKSFKGGELCEGRYADIKDRIKVLGGKFTKVCYCAFKDESGELQIGAVDMNGGVLGAWMDFTKANRNELYKQAVRIKGFTNEKKGKIEFTLPKSIALVPVNEETDEAAKALDRELQAYLKGYFSKTKTEQAADAPEPDEPVNTTDYSPINETEEDTIPF